MPETNPLNSNPEGQLIVGDYRRPVMVGEQENSAAAFCTVVDQENLNDQYGLQVSEINTYFSDRGFRINPVRIVTTETMRKAYAAAGDNPVKEKEEGRNIHGRSVVVLPDDIPKSFVNDFVLGAGLHEAAHSSIEDQEEQAGVFWSEGFADLTRVRGFRYLVRNHTIKGKPKMVDMDGVPVLVVPNDTDFEADPDQNESVIPAEFASIAVMSAGETYLTAVAPANLAAYALNLLDARIGGLYEDMEFAAYYPKRWVEVIRKIDSVRPGLYRELCELEYSGQDFSKGLQTVLEAVSSQTK